MDSLDAGPPRPLARGEVDPGLISAAALAIAIWGLAGLLAAARFDGLTRLLCLLGAAGAMQLCLLGSRLANKALAPSALHQPANRARSAFLDRLSESLLLVGAGYGAAAVGVGWARDAGWLAAVLGLLDAQVGAPMTLFDRRQITLTALSFLAIASALVEPGWLAPGRAMAAGLALIALFSAVLTAIRLARPSTNGVQAEFPGRR